MLRILWIVAWTAVGISLLSLANYQIFGRDATLLGMTHTEISGIVLPVGIICAIAISLINKRRLKK